MTAPTDKHTTVPYRYRARLEWSERIDSTEKDATRPAQSTVEHGMSVAGSVHPEPYEHAAAVVLAQRKLVPLADAGWRVVSLVVTGYDRTDA